MHGLMDMVTMQGPKTPGLVILEHELSDLAVASFMSAYPVMVANGWKRVSLAQMDGLGSYLNALNGGSPVTLAQVGDLNVKPPVGNTTTALKTRQVLYGLFSSVC